jgi:hypothetical protein
MSDYVVGNVYCSAPTKEGGVAQGAEITAVILAESQKETLMLEVWVNLAGRLINPKNPEEGAEPIPAHEVAIFFPMHQMLDADDVEESKQHEIARGNLKRLLGEDVDKSVDSLLKFSEGGEWAKALVGKKLFIIANEGKNDKVYLNPHFFRQKSVALSIEDIKARIRAASGIA